MRGKAVTGRVLFAGRILRGSAETSHKVYRWNSTFGGSPEPSVTILSSLKTNGA